MVDILRNIEDCVVSATVDWSEPLVADNSGFQVLSSTHTPGDSFPFGVTLVTYTASDASGNTASRNFTITVETGMYNTCMHTVDFKQVFSMFSDSIVVNL